MALVERVCSHLAEKFFSFLLVIPVLDCTCHELVPQLVSQLVVDALSGLCHVPALHHLHDLVCIRPVHRGDADADPLHLLLVDDGAVRLRRVVPVDARLRRIGINLVLSIQVRLLEAERTRAVHCRCCDYIVKAVSLNVDQDVPCSITLELEDAVSLTFAESFHDLLVVCYLGIVDCDASSFPKITD